MKREGRLIERIADPENLRLAYWKARKGKEGKSELQVYTSDLENNISKLRFELLNNAILPGKYHYFTIKDPKERKICAAAFSERVLHHAIMNICHENFEKYQVFDSYASRPGKGVISALHKTAINQKKFKWFLKLDVKKYFDSINHEKLKELVRRRFKDRYLLSVFEKIIDSYSANRGVGLPIGNLTSQYFANHYLAFADHFLLEQLKVKAYVRYMDDMVLWDNNKIQLLNIANAFKNFIANELKLELKPFCLNTTEKGLPFCGYLVYPGEIRLNKNSRSRFVKKLTGYFHNYHTIKWDQYTLHRHLLPLLAFVKHANSHGFRSKIITNVMSG